MEQFILHAGKSLAKWRSKINFFLEEKVQKSITHLIFFMVFLYLLILLIPLLFLGVQSLLQSLIIILILSIILVFILVWLAIFYESNKYLQAGRHDFNMISVKKIKVKLDLLNFDKESKEHFLRLVKGYCVRRRINFTMGNKSGESANHRILFVLFDELVVGGIQDLTGERKRKFFIFLMDSFLMNNEPLKENTLKTSFSTWKNDQEKINSRNQRKFVRQLLGKE